MNKDLTLVILAAGMGSRFGGLKQIEPFGPSGEFIIDYSIYDAKEAGFNKVVFIIKEENYEIFKETVGKRVEDHIKVEYCFQKNDNLPEGYNIPEDRVKPFGTGHALLCAKDLVNENFAIISADDFYGKDAFVQLANYLKENDTYCVVGYNLGETIPTTGAVKRGVCMQEDGYLTGIIESKVEFGEGGVVCEPLSGAPKYVVPEDHPVSMIMFGLTPKIFKDLEEKIKIFFEENKDDLNTCEFLLPDVLDAAIKAKTDKIKVLHTTATWRGVTYKEDAENLRNAIKELVDNGEYPENLWN